MSDNEIATLLIGLFLFVLGFSWLVATFKYKSRFSKFWYRSRWSDLFEKSNRRPIYILGGGYGIAQIMFGLGLFSVVFTEVRDIAWLLVIAGGIILCASTMYSIYSSQRT